VVTEGYYQRSKVEASYLERRMSIVYHQQDRLDTVDVFCDLN
jgi:hypothetical protein